jgi:hypothetical protein
MTPVSSALSGRPHGVELLVALFRNFYVCPRCDATWDDVWDAQCDDECPRCSARDISPDHSEDAGYGYQAHGEYLAVEPFVIESQQERGYWSNELGWVFDVASAAKYSADEGAPTIRLVVPDARYVPAASATSFDGDAAA